MRSPRGWSRFGAALIVFAAVPAVYADEFMLVAAVAPPGSSTLHDGPVIRFSFDGTGALNPLSSIPETLLDDPAYLQFSPGGELFVGNRHGNVGGGVGSIARFTFDDAGDFTANGTITGNSLEAVHGLAFSATGELFAANYYNGKISRFLFDATGAAVPNGEIPTATSRNQGLAFNEHGELFSTHASGVVNRWVFDPTTGAASSNGSFSVAGAGSLHGLTFSATGELFVADPHSDRVYRLVFDSSGSPIANGSIPVSGGPLAPAFSPAGELFVSSHFSGGISRFVFDATGTEIANGFTPTTTMGGLAVMPVVDADGDGFAFMADCDDYDASVYPGAPELCDARDNDCDGVVPVDESDGDGDGYFGCDNDCNDTDPAIHPGASELPGNATDENCDGSLGACDPNADWRNHGQFVRCVAHEANDLVAAGEITDEEGDALVRAAAQSDVGR